MLSASLLLTLLGRPAQAQAPVVTSVTPPRNAVQAPPTTNVAATFSQLLSSNAATLGSLKVFSQQAGGKKAGTATVSGNTLSFNPGTDFKGGETVYATVTSAAQSTSGTPATPHVFQFTTATTPSPATFSSSTQTIEGFPLNANNFLLSDLDGNGALDVVGTLPNTNAGSSGAVGIRLNNGDGTFGSFQVANVAISIIDLTTGDIDGDGDLDLVTASSIYPTKTYRISVRFNDGTGSFSGTQQFVVGDNTTDLNLSDVDGDGDLDLLTCNSSTVSIRLNNGSGTFSGNQEVPINASDASAIVVGDLDNDGDLDFATANGNGGISLRLNNGSGSFGNGSDVNVGSQIMSLATGDVDADGDLDIVTAGLRATGVVDVLLNNGAGAFSAGQNLAVGANSTNMALGDLDGDNDLDLVVRANDGVSVRLNNGSGIFSGTQDLLAGSNVRNAVLGDIDGDGDLDILASTTIGTGFSLLQNQPAPTITSITPDVATPRASVTITGSNLLGTTGLTFNGVVAPTYTVKSNTQLIVAVPDGATTGPVVVNSLAGSSNGLPFTVAPIAAVTSVTPTPNTFLAPRRPQVTATFNQPLGTGFDAAQAIRVFSQQSGGRKAGVATVAGNTLRFTPNTDFQAGETLYASATTAAQSSTGVAVRPHVFQFTTATTPSSATFATGANLALYTYINNVIPGDVDGDGDQDLLVLTNASGSQTKVTTYLNTGSGAFTSATQLTLQNAATYLEVGDIDGDGDLDLVIPYNGALDTYLNNGQGAFTFVAGSSANSIYASQFKLRDADGDGDLDMFAIGSEDKVVVYFNNGSGRFGNPRTVTVGIGARYLAVGDLDNDGDLDVVTVPYSYLNTASVRFNDGTGTLSGTQEVPISILPNDLTLGDVDGDGDLDFLSCSNSAKAIDIRLNNGVGVFGGTQSVPVGSGGRPATVRLSDIEGDGDLDILATSTDNAVSIRRNDGTGTFSGNQEIPAGNTPAIFHLRDVDNDGDLDLITASYDVVQVQVNGLTALLPTTFSPTRNARSAPRNTDVSATFNQPLANNAATQGALKVFSRQAGGLKASSATISGNTLTVNPATDFKPGETVFATLTKAAQSSSSLAKAQVFQFTTATAPSTGTFAGGPDVAGAGAVAAGDVDGDGDLDFVNASGGVRLNDGNGQYTNGQQIQITAFSGPRCVTLGDIDSDGDLDLVLSVNTQGVLYIRFNDGAGNFSGTQQIQINTNPTTLVLADINGDGFLDLLSGNYGSNGTVSIRLNNGLGIFSGTQNIDAGRQVNDLAIGDIDNDGDLDLVAPNISDNLVSIRRNDGNGNYSGTESFAATFAPTSVALGDLDGDGDLDLLTATRYRYENGQTFNGDVYVSLNDGTGKFTISQQVGSSSSTNRIMLGDVDGDGDLDYVTSGGSVRLNDGTGKFSGNQEVATTGKDYLELADADGDGDLDIFAGNSGIFPSASVTSVRFNQGITTPLAVTVLAPKRNAPTSPRPTPVAVTFNQALSTGAANQSAAKVFGQQAGLKAGITSVSGNTLTFAPTASFKPGETVFTTVTTVARSASGQTLLKPFVFQFTAGAVGGTSLFTLDNSLSVGNNPQSVALGDLDADGDLDLISASNNYPNGTVSVRLGNGDGTFTASQEVPVGWGPFSVVLGDVDNDGDLDLLAANASFPVATISVRLNNGRGSFSGTQEVLVGNNPHAVALGDVDGDGDLDLLAANYEPASVSIRLNDGAGTFGNGSEVSVGPRPLGLALGDIDNDGDLDVLTANSFNSTVSLRFNNGDGTFYTSTGVEIGVAYNPEAITLGDIDSDGDLDLLTAHPVGNTVSVRFNNGSGTFSGTEQLTVGAQPHALALGDTDGDGDLDLLTANYGSTTASLRLNGGMGYFGGNSEVPVGGNATSVAVGDIDGNGSLDFVTTQQGSNTASVRLNKATGAKVLATTSANLAEQVELYPNPAHESVRLQLPAELAQQAVQLSVVNTLGQVVLEQKLAARQSTPELKLGRLTQGVYNVRLRTASGLVVKRLVIE